MNIAFDEEVLSKVLGVPTEGIKSIRKEEGYTKFLTICSDLDDMNIRNVTKKALKGKYRLLFELVNKCLLSQLKKRTTVILLDSYLMEILAKFKKICLPALIIEHTHTIITTKDRKHGLDYRFWINKNLDYFNVVCGQGKFNSIKQVFNLTTLEDNECVPKRGGRKSKSLVSELMETQKNLKEEIESITALIALKDAKIIKLKASSIKEG